MIIKKVIGMLWIDKCEKKRKEFSRRKIDKLHIWICNHLQVVHPPFTTDHTNIKDNLAGEVIKTQSYSFKCQSEHYTMT